MPRTQVLLADMPLLMADLLRESLEGADVEVLPPGSGVEDLRHVEEDDAPPIVILVADDPSANQFERDLLVPHPQAMILRVEDNGRVLACRRVEVKRRVRSGSMTAESLVETIKTAPNWRARFA